MQKDLFFELDQPMEDKEITSSSMQCDTTQNWSGKALWASQRNEKRGGNATFRRWTLAAPRKTSILV